jgi:probable rRNA maturation factor
MAKVYTEGMSIPSKITLCNTQKDFSFSLRECKRDILFLISSLKIDTDELIVHFVTTKKICCLHRLLFDDPSATDCISVPIDPPSKHKSGYHLLGEIFVCPKTAKLYADEHGLDPHEELMRYVIHGLLHLIGYDDMTVKDRRVMKKKEEECLKLLANRKNKYRPI